MSAWLSLVYTKESKDLCMTRSMWTKFYSPPPPNNLFDLILLGIFLRKSHALKQRIWFNSRTRVISQERKRDFHFISYFTGEIIKIRRNDLIAFFKKKKTICDSWTRNVVTRHGTWFSSCRSTSFSDRFCVSGFFFSSNKKLQIAGQSGVECVSGLTTTALEIRCTFK